ncbi:MAG: Mrp/NBP35 family ATP-binding protein [Pseudomonadota bacterium]
MAKEPLTLRARTALKRVSAPGAATDIVADGRVLDLAAEGATVRVTLDVGDLSDADARALAQAAQDALAAVDNVKDARIVATAHRAGQSAAPPRPAGGHDNPMGLARGPAGRPRKGRPSPDAPLLPEVKRVIAVASGKGGVGKSTVAANLAVALARTGARVGLLDADIYGPSLPTLFGIADKPPMRDDFIVPHEAHGVKLMSIGWLVDEDQALAWRGPMVMGAVRQLMRDVAWGPLDVLLIDTPPGTGDAHLTLAQSKKLDGAVIVSTPQEMALADVRRGVSLFRKVDVPVLGVIENMAYLEGPDGARTPLFGEGGARAAAVALGAPFLGEIPIYPALRAASDAGTPIVAADPDAPAAQRFRDLAAALARAL